MIIDEVFECGLSVVNKIWKTQKEALEEAGRMIAHAHMEGHRFLVSGSGHSHTVAEEFYGRAGGLAFAVPMVTAELTLLEHATKSSYLERLEGYAKILVELFHVEAGDVVFIASNSGRNAYPVELALEAKAKGAHVIAITNVDHSSKTTSRHSSGKKLMDIADIVIDNCGVKGDSALTIEGLEAKMCPTSSIANAFIVQAVSAAAAKTMLEAGCEPPVIVSFNVDGNASKNEEYLKKYTRQY